MDDKIKEVMGLVEALANSSVRWGHASAFVDVDECEKHRNASLEIHKAIESKLRELMPVWLPIKTVPRDGTWIQVWREPEGQYSCVDSDPLIFARWSEDDEAFAWPDEVYDPFTEWGRRRADALIEDGRSYFTNEFTHWMPLPKEPTK